MDATDWHFYTPERRGAATPLLTGLMWAAAEQGARAALETLPLAPYERDLLYQLFAVVLDRQEWQRNGGVLRTVGQLGTELRHAVDLTRLYSDALHHIAAAVARNGYQAALDCLPADGQRPDGNPH